MEPNTEGEGNLLEIMDLARTLRQEQLFIQNEQAAFANLIETLSLHSTSITKLGYICAQQRQNLNDLITSRSGAEPVACCRRANNFENPKFVDAKKIMDYEYAIAYEELFNHLYRSPYLLALSLSTADRIPEITTQHICCVIHSITAGLYGNAINTKDVEMILKLLRELIEIQIVVCENPRRLLRANSSAFTRLYQRLNESMFSAKIFLTAALFEPVMKVLVGSEIMLDVDPNKVIQNLSVKDRCKRFGNESSDEYKENVRKFHSDCISKLHVLTSAFIDNLTSNWSLFPSTLRWLVQTMFHHLKQARFSDQIINEIITDMVFTHFICPAIVSPDIIGITDAPISEHMRFNLIQIGQIIQMLAMAKHDDVDAKFAEIYARFESNMVTKLIDLLLVSRSGEDVVAILSQQSDFERTHLLSTQTELAYFVEFFQILVANEEYDIPREDRDKLKKVLSHLPADPSFVDSAVCGSNAESHYSNSKERSKQSLISLSKATKSKIAKSMSFNTGSTSANGDNGQNTVINGNMNEAQGLSTSTDVCNTSLGSMASNVSNNSSNASPSRNILPYDGFDNEPILVFNIYNSDKNKLQPLTEEEVLKMNCIGQEIVNRDSGPDDCCNLDSNIDKSSVAFDGIDGISDEILRAHPLHVKQTRFSISHDDASIGNSDILEAVSEAPSNHSVTSSLDLEENDQNDNLSDMVSANVSGRGSPNISGRDTPSSQVTDGESAHNVIATPQMQRLLSKARSDIEDKFCKFEIKKLIEVDETVSILSDTWSTDVLASDSETFDANERDRDRDISTPLIPSAVVLPGDNNYDVLAGSGAGRAAFLDVTDQRSESNWSTDVLVSDSEKLDTDDILSLTARSDLTDADVRSEAEPEPRVNRVNVQEKSESSPYVFDIARMGINTYNSPDSFDVGSAASAGAPVREDSPGVSGADNDSDRSQEDSAFFDAVNLYEDLPSSINDATGVSLSSAASLHYQRLSSLARSSVRTTNQFSGENSFQQNYKSSHFNRDKTSFLASKSLTRRQTSVESSISNQSGTFEEHIISKADRDEPPINTSTQSTNNTEGKDLIDFTDYGDNLVSTHPEKEDANRDEATQVPNELAEVVHRRVSTEQRLVVFDGRRNGILAPKSVKEGETNSAAPIFRRHQSLNYENHEIINATVQKHVSAVPNLKNYSSVSDDCKTEQRQQEQLDDMQLAAKTETLQLNDSTVCEPIPAPMPDVISSSSQKPSKSTGAIPKSISFDASADKVSSSSSTRSSLTHRTNVDSVLRHSPVAGTSHSGIFNKLKQGFFKHRRSNKSMRHTSATTDDFVNPIQSPRSVSFKNIGGGDMLELFKGSAQQGAATATCNGNSASGISDISDDILAKYRRKVSTSSEATNSDSTGNGAINSRNNIDPDSRVSIVGHHDKTVAFNAIKKKIRTVLSKTDLHTGDFRHTTYSNASPLLTYLQIQSAQAMNMQNFQQLSYVSEAIRCLASLEPKQHQQILEELQKDIQKRQNYLQYLMRHRQNLLLVRENIEQFESRLRNESTTCNRYLMAVCVRQFLEKRESQILSFQDEFARLTVSDDKIDLIEEFIDGLVEESLAAKGFLHEITDSEWQVREARGAIERVLLQRMYQQVMFPNEDADLSRDTVLFEHIHKLQKIIRPSHPALNIPQEYLAEAPWTFAQQQLFYISAYNTPREKLHCVIRCISSIMSLLHMSSGRVPAADDLLPVLIYVVIMSNPPYLLSTIEYITCFIGDKLCGEEQFHWTIFGSVVKFIKTMDYLD